MALALFALGLVTRIPFATENLYAHDSVLYLRGMERFDPLDQRPQPPGYLYYVLALRAIDLLVHDANRTMTLVAAVAGAATVALVYVLAARLYEERTARVASVFVLTAATFWAYGGVAYPYTLLAALSTLCALLFWRALGAATPSDRGRRLVAASVAWGVAIGFRADLAIFLAPLWLLAVLRTTWATAALSSLAVAASVTGWFTASALADGGIARFVEALGVQTRFIDEHYGVFANGPIAIYRNTYDLARFLGRGLYFLLPLVAAALLSAEARRVEMRDRRRAAFVALWTVAPLPFYVLVHIGEYGYVFSMLPGLAILAARGAIALAKGIRRPRTFRWIVGATALANAAIFLLSDAPLSARDIARQDRGIDEKVAYVRDALTTDSALLVTAYDAVLVDHYLQRAYPVLAYDPDTTRALTQALGCVQLAVRPCSGPEVQVVLWDDLLRAEGAGWRERVMPHGARLRITRAPRDATLRVREGVAVEVVR